MAEEKKDETQQENPLAEMSKEEQIAFHKGCLSVLAKERQEFGRILSIVEQIMQMHLGELKKQGIDLTSAEATPVGKPADKKPIEDIL